MDIKELWGKVQEIFAPLVADASRRAAYPWDQCIADQMKQYGSRETAEKVCGAIKAKYGGRADTNNIMLPDGFDLTAAIKAIEAELGISSELTAEEIKAIDALKEAIDSGRISLDSLPIPPVEEAPHTYHTAKMASCLKHLEEQGADPGKAHRICYAALGAGANRSIALPTQTRALTITRAADGKARWLMIAASAVVNKVGSIDSTLLFDSFIKRAATEGYPRLDFFHEGDHISFGQADWLRRDGALYLASGAFDDTDLARAAAAGLEKDPTHWGASIAYRIASEPLVLMTEGQIPVYTDGFNTFISIVPRNRAANLFTAIGVIEEVIRMDKSVYDELVKLIGEAAAAPFAAEVDDANRTITETGMITRVEPASEPTPAEPTSMPALEPTPAPTEERQDLAALEKAIATLSERVTKLEQSAGGAGQQVQDAEKRAADAMTGLTTRLDGMETGYGQWKQWLDALPEAQRSEATYRPRDAHQADAAPMSSADVVAPTMQKVNARHK